MFVDLAWLPKDPDWRESLLALDEVDVAEAWTRLVNASRKRLDFVGTLAVARAARRRFEDSPPTPDGVRIAFLSSCTVDHLLPSVQVGGMRRDLWVQPYATPFGQFKSDLRNPSSGLAKFKPGVVVFVRDAKHVVSRLSGGGSDRAEQLLDELLNEWSEDWKLARSQFSCEVIQQAILPCSLPIFGNSEHRSPGSPLAFTRAVNLRLRAALDAFGGHVLALDDWCAHDGTPSWHEPTLWYHAKQEVSQRAAPAYGDQVARVVAALRGRSSKCLVLDLDNTLWGGVVGDDGPQGIVLGQGSALGEAYASFQAFVRSLTERGVILAVCSKNDAGIAMEAFSSHPEMILKTTDIACFVANWNDKATNIREIAARLNIGLDSIVFVDDNPFERNLIRRELPMVAVPELPDDPALFGEVIAEAGYFETAALTEEDLNRNQQYRSKFAFEAAKAEATDLAGYLDSLGMVGKWSAFREVDLPRIVQLTNKTNQFNLTTRRLSAEAIADLMRDPDALTLQMRLTDIYGDNGIIALLFARFNRADRTLLIENWLMSCRVLGRTVEQAMLNIIVDVARNAAISTVTGEYIPTAKNDLVRDHYSSLGFLPIYGCDNQWALPVEACLPRATHVRLEGAWT